MKRYLLFAGNYNNPLGGYCDLVFQSNNEQEARDKITESGNKWDWYHLIDALTDRLILAKEWQMNKKKKKD